MKRCAILALSVLALAACGGSTVTLTRTVTRTGTESSPPVVVGDQCFAHEYGAQVSIEFQGLAAAAYCAKAIREWSSASTYWAAGLSSVSGNSVICTLRYGSTRAVVRDIGDGLLGGDLCGQLTHDGWTS